MGSPHPQLGFDESARGKLREVLAYIHSFLKKKNIMKNIIEKMLRSRHARSSSIQREHAPPEISTVQSLESFRSLSFRF